MIFPEGWKEAPYLTDQLLSYLGNKRRLLPLLYTAVLQSGINPREATFVDLFTGSGVVGRLAKKMNFHTLIANDWEPYSYTTQALYLKENPQTLQDLFRDEGGLQFVLEELNSLSTLPEGIKPYISRHYAPTDLDNFDIRKERLFYTPENAIKLDAIRSTIETWYPSHRFLTSSERRKKDILMALLVYEASVHTNTGGVFKAYYKEFGGYGGHALKRILGAIHLPYPELESGETRVFLNQKDALELAKDLEYDTPQSIIYIDPPYNIHQYGSNYHLLNTLVLWDKFSLEDSYTNEGYLLEKAGIRKDWKNTRSSFCSKASARESFQALVNQLPADILMVSYSTDGLIDFKEMLYILGERGEVNILSNPYTKYPGGKKSLTRLDHNIEFVLWVDTNKPKSKSKLQRIFTSLEAKQIRVEMSGIYILKGVLESFSASSPESWFSWNKRDSFKLQFSDWGELRAVEGFETLSTVQRKEVRRILAICKCLNKKEELITLMQRVDEISDSRELSLLWQRIYKSLQSLAHHKNREDFLSFYRSGQVLLKKADFPKKASLVSKWQQLWELFQKRMAYAKR